MVPRKLDYNIGNERVILIIIGIGYLLARSKTDEFMLEIIS